MVAAAVAQAIFDFIRLAAAGQCAWLPRPFLILGTFRSTFAVSRSLGVR
jgi:hypothetical protein